MSCQSRVKVVDKTIIEGRIDLDIGHRVLKLSTYPPQLVLNPLELREDIVYQFSDKIFTPLVNLEDSIMEIGPKVTCRIKVEKVIIRGFVKGIKLKSFNAKVEYR